MRTINFLVDANAAVAQTTVGVEVGEITNFSVQVNPNTASGVAGTLVLQSSNDNVIYVDVPSSSQAVAPGASHIWNVTGAGYKYIRVVWTPDAATSSLAWARAAGVAAVTGKNWAIKSDATGLTWVRYGNVTGAAYVSSGTGPYLVTVTSTGHNLADGDQIAVSGGSDGDVDGTQTITTSGLNAFTFSVAADPTASGTLNYAGLFAEVTKATHGLVAGQSITCSGTSDAVIDAVQTVSALGLVAGKFRFKTVTPITSSGTSNLAYYKTATPTVEVTSNSHGIASATVVTIASSGQALLNGNKAITSTGINTFTLPAAAGALSGASGTLAYQGISFDIQVTEASHGLTTGDLITVAGGSSPLLDGQRTITTYASGTFNFTNTSADPGASGTLGYLGVGTISALFIGKDNPNRA